MNFLNNKAKKMQKTTLLIVLLIPIGLISNAQYSINLTKGQKTHLISKSVSIIKQNVMGKDVVSKSDVTLDIDIEVKEIIPNIHLTHSIKRIQLLSERMGNSIVFDSDKKEDMDNQIGQMVSGTLDKPFGFYITSIGTPLENKESDPSFEAAKNVLGELDGLNFEFICPLPKRIKVGDHWENELITDANNKSKYVYKVISLINDGAVLSFSGNINKKKFKTIQGIETIATANTISNGELNINTKTGVITEKNTESISKGATQVMGQNIPFTVITNSKSSTK
jgi:hypothetical protein